jgi:hypothetical protein
MPTDVGGVRRVGKTGGEVMTMPSLRTFTASCVFAVLGTGAVASEPSTEATTAFEKLKALPGQWVAKGPQGTAYITYSPAARDSTARTASRRRGPSSSSGSSDDDPDGTPILVDQHV